MSLPRSACAAVGCALPSSHSSAAECRRSAARAPLWAACCLVAPNAAECRLPAARAPLWAACCHPNTECRGSAVCRIRVPQNVVAPQCVRRCGCALPSMHPNAQEFRRIRTPKKFCSASAAVGRALPSSHPYAHASRKHDDK